MKRRLAEVKENASVCFIPQASTKFLTQLPGDFIQYL
jgi:hypothetical protein